MDLDELKSQLNQKLATDHAERSAGDLAQLLQKRTTSIVGKLKRSLLFEIRLSVPFIILFLGIAILGTNPVYRGFFAVFSLVVIITFLFLVYLYRTTKRIGDTPLPVKENLQVIVNIIDEFVKRCFQAAIILVPVCVALMAAGQYYYRDPHSATFNLSHNRWITTPTRMLVFLVSYTVVFTIAMYFFAKWYLRKMYGRYTEQLRNCIRELEE